MFEVFSIANAFGLLGFIIVIVQLQLKDIRHIYWLDLPLNLCWAIHFGLLGGMSGVVCVLFAGMRSYSKLYLSDEAYRYCLSFIAVSMTFTGLYMYQNIYSLLPIIANLTLCLGTLGHCRKRYTDILIICLSLWAVYGLCIGSMFGFLDSIFALSSCVIGKMRHEGFRFGLRPTPIKVKASI